MAGMRSRMRVMEAIEARSGFMPEMISLVSNIGPATAAGIIKEVIVAPITVVHGAIVTVIITVIVHRRAGTGGNVTALAGCYGQQRGSGENLFPYADQLGQLGLPDVAYSTFR